MKTSTYHGVGTVEELNQQQSEIQLNHGDIARYMEAMSVTYPLKNWSIVGGLKVGDRVEFALERGSWKRYSH